MTSEELKKSLQDLYDDRENVGVTVYAILKDGETETPVKLDIESEAQNDLKDLFFLSLRDTISNKNDLSILNLSSSDERLDAIYVYDLEIPEELSSMETVVSRDDLLLMNLNNQSLTSIKALLIEMGNNTRQMVLYKSMAPINIFGRKNFFLKKTPSRLEKLDDEFLRISSGFQLLRIDGALLVIDLEAIEKSFGFHDVIKKEASAGIDAIEACDLLENPEVLRDLVDDVKYARKFTKVAKLSPVLNAQIPKNEILDFCKTFPSLLGRIRFNDAGDKILLDTKISKDLFIGVLMDNFLTSELTKLHYASVAKDGVDRKEDQ